MMRRLKLLLWFCFGLVLGGASTYAVAETIAATPVPNQKESRCINPINGGASWDWRAQVGASNNSDCIAAGYNGYYSDWNGCATPMLNRACTWSGRTVTLYQCPSGQNWTLSGTSCSRPDCSAGQIRDPASGVCINDCNGAAAKAVNGQYVSGSGSAPAAGSLCVGGCFYGHDTCGSWSSGGVQKYVCRTTSATGQNCSGTGVTQSTAAEAACAAQGQGTGTINGITVCAGKFESQKTEAAKTETKVNPDATTDTKSITSTTECKDGKCTTTTTETVVIGGGPPQTTTKTEEQPIADYCTKNPLDPQCVGKEEEDTCSKFPDRLDCKELGTAPQADPVQTQDKGIGNITQYTTAAGSCPADVALPRGATWDFGPVCDLAQSVRPIVIALGWLFAGLMIFGYFRS